MSHIASTLACGCRVWNSAVQWWDEFEGVPPAEDVIEQMIALGPEQSEDREIMRAPVSYTERKGVVFGHRFRMLGYCPDGRWTDVVELHPIFVERME